VTGLPQPYPSAAATADVFAEHVNAGKVATFRALGLELVTLVATVALLVRVPFPVATAKAVAP